jgi:uncharacterized membrane protein YjjP (DUF1212 family)
MRTPTTDSAEIDFILKLGRALHMYGSAAHRLEDVLGQVAQYLGLEGQFFSTPTSIFSAIGPENDQRAYLIRVNPGEVDLGRLSDLDYVVICVLREHLTPAEGARRIDTILNAPPRYHPILDVASFGIFSAAIARTLGGGLTEILVSGGIGLVIGLISLAAQRSQSIGRVFTATSALVAAALAAAVTELIGPYAVFTATLAGLIALLPGFKLTVALAELSTQHLASGTARLSEALINFLELIFGVAIGGRLVSLFLETTQTGRVVSLPAWTEYLALFIAGLALTVRLRAIPRDAIWIVLAGALAVAGSRIGSALLDPELGVFVGALTVGLASNLFARVFNRPSAIPWVAGLILLVPGSVGFRSFTSLLDNKVVLGVETAFNMILIATALVAGTFIANVILPPRKLS